MDTNKVEKIEPININADAVLNYDAPQFDIDRAIANIRKALAGEEKTIAEYIEFASHADEWFPTLAIMFREIADEEKVHVGELKAMLQRFENNHIFMQQGAEEVAEIETKFANAKTIETIERMLADMEENENFQDKKQLYKTLIERLIKE